MGRRLSGGCRLMTKSNSERVRLAPANNGFVHRLRRGPGGLARRCCVALLFSAAVLSPPLSAATAPPATAATAKPGFVIQAEKNYRRARQAARAAQHDLSRLNQQEAREGQRAMAKHGQWIEPAGLWRKTRAAERNLAFARVRERHARTELNVARNTARTMRVGGFPPGEFQPSTTWWPW
jgi:hypothetical protein